MFVTKEFDFSATAMLRIAGEEGVLQGHNYELRVTIKGMPDENGIVFHTSELAKTVEEKIISRLDKKNLNDVIGNPTMENTALWVWKQLQSSVKGLYEVHLWENRKKGNSVIYRG